MANGAQVDVKTAVQCLPRGRSRRSLVFAAGALVSLVLLTAGAPDASAHAAFLGSIPAPGQRLTASPPQIVLRFTEQLDRRLSTAALFRVATGARVPASVTARSATSLALAPGAGLDTSAYRVEWHSVSTNDGHALEGSYSFGVRAAAVSGAHTSQGGPLAGAGWVRWLVRSLFDAALLTFAGALLLAALLQRGRQPWLVPAGLSEGDPAGLLERTGRRYRSLVLDAGLVAVGLGSARAVLDGIDAAGGLSVAAIRDYLVHNNGGLARVAVVACAAAALAVARRSKWAAALLAAGALAALAVAGHADAASPRGVALLTDWVHLVAGAVWLGGLAVVVLTWMPSLHRGGRDLQLAVARDVLPRFGVVAVPAFAVVVVTGMVNAVIELGRVTALWETGYGRVLLAKVALVAMIATASFVHAFVMRPRMLASKSTPELERRHWRLISSEPVLGAGVAVAVALLVAFPPPANVSSAVARDAAALAAPCDPCPLPAAKADELAVAEQGGSNVVAAWIRRGPRRLTGKIRLIDRHGQPSASPFEIEAARQVSVSCGIGCRRFSIVSAGRPPGTLVVNVLERGHEYAASLPTRWRPDRTSEARSILLRAQATMRRLRTVREDERVQTIPGITAETRYRLQAPNKFAYVNAVIRAGVPRPRALGASIVLGKTQWFRVAGSDWRRQAFGGGLAFRTRSWFTWTSYAQAVRLLDVHRESGRRIAVLALADPGTPAWWRLFVDLRTMRVVRDRLVTKAHFMTQRYFAFNAPLRIRPPSGLGS